MKRLGIVCGLLLLGVPVWASESHFPDKEWEARTPEECGMDGASLDQLAEALGGRGCVIRDGYVVKAWGDQREVGDWFSSAKPVLSTLLFFSIEEGRVKGVDQPIADFGWALRPEHHGITFRHLGAMSSGYARPEGAGKAWAYNDFAIQLYQKTLFEKVFQAHGNEVAAERLAALGFEDGLKFNGKHRLKASLRDFARIVWFWTQRGVWKDRQVLPRKYFDLFMRPQTPKDLPQTQATGTDDDYLGIGSYGGGSDHFSGAGPGIYGFNWWFNDTGRLHPDALTWPDAPADTVMTLGARGNSSAFIPSLNVALLCMEGNWGEVKGGDRGSKMNRALKLLSASCGYRADAPRVSGVLRTWRPVAVDFPGPKADEDGHAPNPFLDYRLQVRFTGPSGQDYDVPGFFDGDGAGGGFGGVWRALFSPDAPGEWHFRASFRTGNAVAVSLEKEAGATAGLDGMEGSFAVLPADEEAPGFYARGRLEYAGGHYLKFRDEGYWLKGGTDSPEDFLAYAGFVHTPASHTYAAHAADWNPGDPDWGGGAGKGIIGAVNYLATMGVNSLYALTMNIGGDGKNVYPYLEPIEGKGSEKNDNLHFDVAKLYQWGRVFEHAQDRGIALHLVLNEAEEANKRELDNGALGVERKLYYRELAARFGHFPALQWNLCEEYNLGFKLDPDMVKACAQYLGDVDPYDHPITVHHASTADKAWTPFLGDKRFTVTSFQMNKIEVVEAWRKKSREAGWPLMIGMDEFFPDMTTPENTERHRKEYLWPIYFSGGQCEFILGDLLKTEDFREYEALWRYVGFARSFMEKYLPFWEMEPRDDLLRGSAEFAGKNNVVAGQVFAKPGYCYAVYFPVSTETGVLNLREAEGTYTQRWFNPRTGAFSGGEKTVQGGGETPLGPPPGEPEADWVVLLERCES